MREEIERLKAENEQLRADYAALEADVRDVRDALARTFSKDDPAQIFTSATDKLERAPVLWAYERANSVVGAGASQPQWVNLYREACERTRNGG
jgi:hypothetical protein